MGMFDTIAWGEKLPFSPEMEELGLNKNDWSFQTKDLDNGMDEYVVQEGKIFLIAYEKQEWVEGDKDSKDLFAKIGHIERTGRYLKPIGQFEVEFHLFAAFAVFGKAAFHA